MAPRGPQDAPAWSAASQVGPVARGWHIHLLGLFLPGQWTSSWIHQKKKKKKSPSQNQNEYRNRSENKANQGWSASISGFGRLSILYPWYGPRFPLEGFLINKQNSQVSRRQKWTSCISWKIVFIVIIKTTDSLWPWGLVILGVHACSVAWWYPTLHDSVNYSQPGFSVHGLFQARMLEWVANPSFRRIFPTQGLNQGLLHCRQILYCWSWLRPCQNMKQMSQESCPKELLRSTWPWLGL